MKLWKQFSYSIRFGAFQIELNKARLNAQHKKNVYIKKWEAAAARMSVVETWELKKKSQPLAILHYSQERENWSKMKILCCCYCCHQCFSLNSSIALPRVNRLFLYLRAYKKFNWDLTLNWKSTDFKERGKMINYSSESEAIFIPFPEAAVPN